MDREVSRRILAFIEQYGVLSPERLREKIRDRKIDPLPALEDALCWANLLVYREGIQSKP